MPRFNRRHVIAGAIAGTGALATAAAVPLSAQAPQANLKGKAILVTGTSSGFGRLGALLYARAGAKVFATMRNLPRPQADELREIDRTEKLDLTVLELDVTSDASVTRAIAEAERLSDGALDVLVNNAGVNLFGPVELQDMAAMQLSFDTNVFGPQRTARAALPAMRARKAGLIVNVSSQQGRVIRPDSGVSSATKFALEALSEQLAYELVPHGIEVVIIEPGGFPTNIGHNRAVLTQALAARIDEERAAAYPELVKAMRTMPRGTTWPGAPDPLMVPLAIAEIAAMAPGTRPLRRAVSGSAKPQSKINEVCRETQLAWLGDTPFGPWVRDVLD